MSSRNPFGDTTRGADDDRNSVGGGSTGGGGTSGGSSTDDGGGGGGGGGGGRDRDDDDDDRRNPLGDTTRGADDDRQQTSGGRPDVGGSTGPRDDRNQAPTESVSVDLPRTPESVGGADFREDTRARNVAETIADVGGNVGESVADSGLDAVGAGPGPDRQVVERVGQSLGRIPGDLATTGVDVAQGFQSVAEASVRGGPGAAVEQTNDLTADAVDAGLSGADRLVDIDRERRQRGEGALVQVEDANRQDAAVTATVSALTLAGGSAAGTATGLSLRGAASRVGPDTSRTTGSSGGVEADPVPTGRSDVGTGGVGQVLDPDTVDARAGADTVDVGDTSVDTGGRPVGDTAPDTGSLPLENTIADAGGVRRMLDEQRAGVRDFLGDERAQAGFGRQREPTTADVDPTRPDDAGGTFADVRQDALTQLQDDLGDRARRPDPGNFDGGPDPLAPAGGGGRRGTIDPDTGEVDLGRSRGLRETRDTTDTDTAAATTPSGISAGVLGVGLGQIAATNDPSGVAPGNDTLAGDGVADTVLGNIGAANDPTAIAPDSDTDTGLLAGSGSTTETAQTDLEAIRAETGLQSGLDTRQETRLDTTARTDNSTIFGTESRLESALRGETETSTRLESALETRLRLGSELDTGRPRRPPGLPELDDDDDDERGVFGIDEDSRRFDSGIASPEDFGVGPGSGDPFRL
jgi:hypothetical protein